jgi:SAM-dependent methyltransferase
MIGASLVRSFIDQGRSFDYGRIPSTYAAFRSSLPDDFYRRLQRWGIGLPGHRLLDLGTGTGIVARAFARRGAIVTGIDISEGMIGEARRLAIEEGVQVRFVVAAAEALPFAIGQFEAATANQCFLYFDKFQTIVGLRKILAPDALLVVSQFRRLASDAIVASTEALIKKFNPSWGGGGYDGSLGPCPQWVPTAPGLIAETSFWFDVDVPFTRESWRGRIRATRGVGASLSAKQVDAFDAEHDFLLSNIAPEKFAIKHRLEAHILRFV